MAAGSDMDCSFLMGKRKRPEDFSRGRYRGKNCGRLIYGLLLGLVMRIGSDHFLDFLKVS
jgi:hypothetical protein